MNFWTAVVIIVAIAAFANIRMAKYRYQSRAGEPGPSVTGNLPAPREAELQREIEDLRERIKVLERIAIDGRSTRALSDEIERLRDK